MIQSEFLDYVRSGFKFDHFHEPATVSGTVHMHAYGLKSPKDGHRALSSAVRISTDVAGVGEALDVQAETRIEPQAIVAALEVKISSAARFSPFDVSAALENATPDTDSEGATTS